jgi:hypothetical protein
VRSSTIWSPSAAHRLSIELRRGSVFLSLNRDPVPQSFACAEFLGRLLPNEPSHRQRRGLRAKRRTCSRFGFFTPIVYAWAGAAGSRRKVETPGRVGVWGGGATTGGVHKLGTLCAVANVPAR